MHRNMLTAPQAIDRPKDIFNKSQQHFLIASSLHHLSPYANHIYTFSFLLSLFFSEHILCASFLPNVLLPSIIFLVLLIALFGLSVLSSLYVISFAVYSSLTRSQSDRRGCQEDVPF